MFNKKKRVPAYVFLTAFVALIVAAAIAFLCPIPDKFRQLVISCKIKFNKRFSSLAEFLFL